MLKALYLTAVVISFAFIVSSVYYATAVSSARWTDNYNSANPGGSYESDYSSYQLDDELTREAGLVSLLFFLFYVVLEVITLVRLKTRTMKILNPIGMSLTGIFIVWNLIMINAPGHISFDEVAILWVLVGLAQLSFSIAGTVHAFRQNT